MPWGGGGRGSGGCNRVGAGVQTMSGTGHGSGGHHPCRTPVGPWQALRPGGGHVQAGGTRAHAAERRLIPGSGQVGQVGCRRGAPTAAHALSNADPHSSSCMQSCTWTAGPLITHPPTYPTRGMAHTHAYATHPHLPTQATQATRTVTHTHAAPPPNPRCPTTKPTKLHLTKRPRTIARLTRAHPRKQACNC